MSTRRRQVSPSASAADGAPVPPSGRRALDARAWLTLMAWVVGTVAVGAGVGLLAGPDGWFDDLAKPTWNPPPWLFAPVWTALYASIGLAAWMIGREPDVAAGDRRLAWTMFVVQAVLNLAWTPLFFGLHQPGFAFLDLCLLWLAVLAMTLLFGRIRPLAGYLMAPYVLWVSFALVLNGTIWLMN